MGEWIVHKVGVARVRVQDSEDSKFKIQDAGSPFRRAWLAGGAARGDGLRAGGGRATALPGRQIGIWVVLGLH